MCGRFEIHSSLDIISRIFLVDFIAFTLKPSYNIAPAQDIAVVINEGNKNRLVSCRWGLLPSWARERKTGYSMINARAETVHTNRSFKDAFTHQRCIVIADGFYEWLKQGNVKVPYYIRLRSKTPMGFAGLYTIWTSPEGEEIRSCTIITTKADTLLMPVHNRMPAILHPGVFRLWLDPCEHNKETLLPLLKPFPAEELEAYTVSPKVNSFKYNHADNIEPVEMPHKL